ncbi:hypothetical protein FBZ93_10347 [Bradyrhizobium macuxiense]|uniref:Uncharacterized protein n=1 Tax=Bradyrhizobium macuxiense TaxID=1755647 RepID=A0A560MBP7_9BRAD|nr:hypothetical protein FBZ93_10347 [Bradyrhizobium macuxiense]
MKPFRKGINEQCSPAKASLLTKVKSNACQCAAWRLCVAYRLYA